MPIGLEKSTELSQASQGQVRNSAADLARAFLPRLRISREKAPAKEKDIRHTEKSRVRDHHGRVDVLRVGQISQVDAKEAGLTPSPDQPLCTT